MLILSNFFQVFNNNFLFDLRFYSDMFNYKSNYIWIKQKLFYLKITPFLYIKTSDVLDSLSESGSGRILPFLSDIRIRPNLDMKKISESGSSRISTKKKIRVRFRPVSNRDPADSDLVSKKEYTEKYFFKNKPCVN